MAMQDQTLTCRDCGNQFTWTAGEQEFYQQKGFTNPPSRCPDCRSKRKADFRNNRGPRQMYKAVCANCGKECEVPFEPKNGRPVYCNDCFRKMRGMPDATNA